MRNLLTIEARPLISVDFRDISIGKDGIFSKCPDWFSAFVNFSASEVFSEVTKDGVQEISVITVPSLEGVTSALAIIKIVDF